jgi:hypothetical protein
MQLQQHLGEPLHEVTIGGHSVDAQTGMATPFGVALPGVGGPVQFGGGGMPMPSYPNQPMPPQADENLVRLSLARQLLDIFIHMRHHMIEAAGVPDEENTEPGEEWKQRQMAENAHVFEFSPSETKLYESACNVLATFLDGGNEPA